ncbi:MAG: BamA/TamA family outer membrane protein [Aureliella sp.]
MHCHGRITAWATGLLVTMAVCACRVDAQQASSGAWQGNAAGSNDLYRGPMQATDATRTAQVPQSYRQPPNIAYQPPSVQSMGPPAGPRTYVPPSPAATYPGTFPGNAYSANPYAGAQPGGYPPQGYVPPSQPAIVGQPPTNLGLPPVTSPSDFGNILAPAATQPPAPQALPGQVLPGQPPIRTLPIDVFAQESRQTGRFMIGGTVNSDLGVAGNFILEERNFDFRALRPGPGFLYGGNQHLRIEIMPGTEAQRYAASWHQPNLFGVLPYSLSLGGFYYTRDLRDWGEQRAGGRIAMGYEISRNISISGEFRGEDVTVFDPRKAGVADLDNAVGSSDIYRGRVRLVRDTRDSTFLTTRGGLLELVFDQVFGEHDYSRGQVNWSRYFPIGYNPDPDRIQQTIAHRMRLGITGSGTPIFDNYYAGGFSTIRGFEFRGASPREMDIEVGGELMLLGSLEYAFPLTADGMVRSVAFVDYGTVERDITITSENFRTSLGLGLRVTIPALGPAPLAVDFAYPVLMADTDERQLVSFYVGATR